MIRPLPFWRAWGPAIVLLVLCFFLRFPKVLVGEVVSADDHLSVHPAFQQEAGGRVVHPHLSDPALQFRALEKSVLQALQAGEAPLWNRDLYAGAPLLADAQSMVGSPRTWIRLLLPADPAQNIGVAWVLVWGSMGMAGLAATLGRRWARANDAEARWMGGIGALTYFFLPFPHVWLLHPHAATATWIPWLVWSCVTGRSWVIALSVFGLSGGGHPGTWVHGMAFGILAWVVGAPRGERAKNLGGLGVGLLLASPLLLPLAEQALRSETLVSRVGSHLQPKQLLDLLWPGALGHPARETWQGTGAWADGQLNPGPLTLLLAVLTAFRSSPARYMLALWVACLSFSYTGLPGPFAHARLGGLGALLVVLAASLALPTLRVSKRNSMILAGLLLIQGLWMRRSDQSTLPAREHDPTPAAWTTQLAQSVGEGRVLGLGWMLQPNTGSLAGLADLRGYDLPISHETARLMGALRAPPQGPWFPVDQVPPRGLLQFAAVRALVHFPDHADLELTALEALPLPSTVAAAHWVEHNAPRAWLATSAEHVLNPDEAIRRLQTGDRRGRPPVEIRVDALSGTEGWQPAKWQPNGPNAASVTLPADHSAGLLVISEAWAPGWVAWVDGNASAVLRVGGAFQGVEVPAGARLIKLRYQPAGWTWGLRLGGVGFLGLLVLIGKARRGNA
jgi:hypothetical protein